VATCGATNTVDYVTIPGGIAFPVSTAAPGTYPTTLINGISFTDRFCDVYFGYANTFVRSKKELYIKIMIMLFMIYFNFNSYLASVKPFMLSVRTDGLEAASTTPGTNMNDASVGFCFKWQQSPS